MKAQLKAKPFTIPELSKAQADLSAAIQTAERIASRFNIVISPWFGGLNWHVEGSKPGDDIFQSLTDQIIESEPTAENPISREDLEALFTVFDFTDDEKIRLFAACEIDDEAFDQWQQDERRLNGY